MNVRVVTMTALHLEGLIMKQTTASPYPLQLAFLLAYCYLNDAPQNDNRPITKR